MKNFSFLSMAFLAIFSVTSCSDQPFDSPDEKLQLQTKTLNTNLNDEENLHPDVDGSYQAKANEYLEKINKAFSSTPGREKNGISDYPGYYGGAYINPQGKLVVLIKGNSTKRRKTWLT